MPASTTLPALIARGALDAPLAGLVWLLAERGVPVLVAAPDVAAGGPILDALIDALPAPRRPDPTAPAAAGRLVRIAGLLARDTPPGVVRAALRATTGTSGLAALVDARDLAGVLAILAGQGLSDDEVSFLGVVLVVERRDAIGGEARVTAAHYLRPLLRDAGGHPRRERPAVLATWDPGAHRWEDFGWGLGPDLAERCRMRTGDFEVERSRRAALLVDLVATGAVEPAAMAAARERLAFEVHPRGD